MMIAHDDPASEQTTDLDCLHTYLQIDGLATHNGISTIANSSHPASQTSFSHYLDFRLLKTRPTAGWTRSSLSNGRRHQWTAAARTAHSIRGRDDASDGVTVEKRADNVWADLWRKITGDCWTEWTGDRGGFLRDHRQRAGSGNQAGVGVILRV